MNSPYPSAPSGIRGFISAKLALVLAVIIGGSGVLAYEWHHTDTAKTHQPVAPHHHHHNAHPDDSN